MTDLRARLKKAADWAELHARHGQEVYTHYYNLRSRDKRFDEGDKVIVDDGDAAGKLCKRWQGPATVVRVKSPYCYLVDMGDGRVRHVHANKMRKFYVRVHSCNIISENSVDFGRVLVPAIDESDMLPGGSVDRGRIEHLDPGQQGELTNEFAACFSDKPVLCRVCRMWLLFVFLVCGILTRSMTICRVCETVKLLCLFGTVAECDKGYLGSCASI